MVDVTASQVDLTNCDREPIHLLGSIDAVGCLFGFSADWILVHVSENCQAFTGSGADDLLGVPATEIFTADALHTIRGRLQWLHLSDASERLFGIDLFGSGKFFDVSVQLSDRLVIVEIEPSVDIARLDALSVVRSMMTRLAVAPKLKDFFDQAARQVRFVTDFDRVMIYRFLADDSGEVIAESRSGFAESFLGLRYPASDIPKQARALYLRNLLRLISDVDGDTASIIPPTSPEGAPLDLSLSTLRTVSPIHLEYLRNMGVRASLSISIVIDGRLWGLFACHNLTPKRVRFDRRTIAELFSQMFSHELANRTRADIHESDIKAREFRDRIMVSAATEGSVFDNLSNHLPHLKDIINSEGAGIWVDGRYTAVGRGATAAEMSGLVRFLNRTGAGRVFATNELSKQYLDAKSFSSRIAGILAIPVSRSPRDYLIFFRHEIAQSVNWAGNPEKPVELGPSGIRLTPRTSFEIWRELVRDQSAPWTEAELRVAESLRTTFLEVTLRHIDHNESNQEHEQKKQEVLIRELNHRVRNILSLIRAIASKTGEAATDVPEFIEMLDGRVQSLARAHDQLTTKNWTASPLRALIENETAAFQSDNQNRFELDGPKLALEPQAYTSVALVLHELVTNAVKHGSLSNNQGRVKVAWSLDDAGSLIIDWNEVDGPAVGPMGQRGFGSSVIERSIPFDLNGKAEINYAVSGITARFLIPAKFVRDVDDHDPVFADACSEANHIPSIEDGGSIMLAEDNLIIALDAENMLRKVGFKDVLITGNVAGALRILAEQRPTAAVLDIDLGNETSIPIARELVKADIRFVFASGYGERYEMPAEFREVPILAKPYTAANLRSIIGLLFSH